MATNVHFTKKTKEVLLMGISRNNGEGYPDPTAHIAVPKNTWLEPVSDTDYKAATTGK